VQYGCEGELRLAPKNSRREALRIGAVALASLLGLAVVLVWHMHAAAHHIPPATREGRWQEDLSFFAREYPSDHKDFDKIFGKEKFAAEMAVIEETAPQSSDAEIILKLMRFVASGHVGHSVVRFPPAPMAFHRLPLNFYWYSDGLAVIAASKEYTNVLGARVVRIGTMTPEQVEAGVASYFSYENETWLHQQSPIYMIVQEILRDLKLTNVDGTVDITFADADGIPFTLGVAPADWSANSSLITAIDGLKLPAALYRKNSKANYWYEYLPDSQTLYIQYNRCVNDPNLSMKDFSKRLFAFADSHAIQRTIVDLRFNQGGDSSVINPLERGLKSRKALSSQTRLIALIGPATFSSGLMAAMDLRDDLHAVLIGEPTGEKPNSYGEVKMLKLPNSQLEISYCTKFFRLMKNEDPPALAPGIIVKRSIADFLAGRDPVLEAALHYSQ
jgi:hypothetical protein